MKINFYALAMALFLSTLSLAKLPQAEAQLITEITAAQLNFFLAQHNQTKVKHYTNGYPIIDHGSNNVDTGAIIAVDPISGSVVLIQTSLEQVIFKSIFQLPPLPLYGKPVAWTRIVANPLERSFTSKPRLTIRRDIEKLAHELQVTETFGILTDKAGTQYQATLSSLTTYADARVQVDLNSDGRSLNLSLTNKNTPVLYDIYIDGKKHVLGKCKFLGGRTIECIDSSNGARTTLYQGPSYESNVNYDGYNITVTPLTGSGPNTDWYLDAREISFKPIAEDNSTTFKLPDNIKGDIKYYAMDMLKEQLLVTTTTGQVASFAISLKGGSRKTQVQFTQEIPVFTNGRFSGNEDCTRALL